MLEKLVIEGGHPLQGEIKISGAKNAALPILASALLSDQPLVLTNVPRLRDVETTVQLLKLLGTEIDWQDDCLRLHTPHLHSIEAPYELVRTMRASILFLGPLLARAGKARISLPGGCAIGARPIDLHLQGLNRLGAQLTLQNGYVEGVHHGLRGETIYFDIPTVTGTMNVMMAACLASGTTIIDNAAREPEVEDLANSLIQRGAKIQGAGSSLIKVEGVASLRGGQYAIMADRIEAGTYLAAATMTRGRVKITGIAPRHLQATLDKLTAVGATIRCAPENAVQPWIEIGCAQRPVATDIQTQPFPGFATDMQAQFMALLTTAAGNSAVTENIFENRFMHVSELSRMGANLKIKGNTVFIEGVERLTAAPTMATDLRASASLVIAALAAKGVSEVRRIYHLDRGYERMDLKLQQLGAKIARSTQ